MASRLLTGILICILFCTVSYADSNMLDNVKRILLVDSYSSADIWTNEIANEFKEYLNRKDVLGFYESYEFGVRFQKDIKPAENDIKALQAKLSLTRYDLIVLMENPIVQLFLDGTLKVDENTPVLIMSYTSREPLKNAIPTGMNATGIQILPNLQDNINLAKQLRSSTKKNVYIIEASGTRSGYLEDLPEAEAEQLSIISGAEKTTDEMLATVTSLPGNTLLLYNSWSSVVEEKSVNHYHILKQLKQTFPGLVFGKYSSYIPYGSAGGWVIDSKIHGQTAGKIAYRIFQGEQASSIPIQLATPVLTLDYRELKRLNIDMAQIPHEALLLNQPPDFISQYRYELAGTFLLLIIVFAFYATATSYRHYAQRKIKLMFRNLPLRIFVSDQSGKMFFSHYPDMEKSDRKLEHVEQLPPQARQIIQKGLKEALNGKEDVEYTYELWGQYRNVKFFLLPAHNPFKRNAVMWTSSDITELYSAHRETARMAERFRLTLESIGDGVITTDPDQNITLINPVAAKLTGFGCEEAIGKNMAEAFKIISYIDGKPVESPLTKAIRENRIVELANHTDLISRNGDRRHIADSAAPICDSDGTCLGGVLVFRDVTKEYNQRDLLRKNDLILKKIIEIGQFAYFTMQEDFTVILSGTDNIFWPVENGKAKQGREWVSDEFIEEFEREWTRLFKREISKLDLIYSTKGPEGKRFFEMRVEESVNEINGHREFCGIIQEITQARESECRNMDNLKMMESILDCLPGAFFVKNANDDLRYLRCNRNFFQMTGFSPSCIIGKTDSEIFSFETKSAEKFREGDLKVLRGEPYDSVEIFKNASGKQFIVRAIKSTVTCSDGTQLLIGIIINISRQHQLEQAQKENIRMLNNYINNERIINQSLARITVENDFSTAIHEILGIIGENADADRCYIRQYDKNYSHTQNDYSWSRDGVQFSLPADLEMTEFLTLRNRLLNHEDVIIADTDNPPPGLEKEAEFLSSNNVRSTLTSGIWVDNRLYGFVGMNFVRNKKDFSDCEIHTVRSIANLFCLARERKLQIEKIADTESLQRQIIDNISIPIIITDTDFNIVMANPETISDYEPNSGTLIGKKCYDTICGYGSPPEWCPSYETLRTRKMCSNEVSFNNLRVISTSQPIFNRQQEVIYLLNSRMDITELFNQKQDLKIAMEKALAADRAKSYFLATVSHELRTPLNAVIGFSELLQSDDISASECREYLKSINFAGIALLNLINDVLNLSRLEADQEIMTYQETDVTDLIENTAKILRQKALEKNLRLQVELSSLPDIAWIDHLRLRQIIINLLGNAIKFTEAGEVSLEADFICGTEDSGQLTLRVSDTGIGISQENIDKIFDPFVRDENVRGQKVYEGTGLGLAICSRLLRKMGGSIQAESQPGKGSTFTVQLYDVKYQKNKPKPELLPQIPVESKQEPCTYCALLVDDVVMNLKVLEALLKKVNIVTFSATSGAQALEILQNNPQINLIMTDLWMPEMDGADLARRIRQKRGSEIPIIAVTADSQAKVNPDKVFDDILLKPITRQNLQEAFDRTMPNQII